MPWTTADAAKHMKGLTKKQQRAWMHVANSALKSCLAAGGSDASCAGKAVRQANGVAGKMGESAPELTIEEAATLKSQAQQLLRQLKSILGRKDLDSAVHTRIESTLNDLQKRWSDLAPAETVAAASESDADPSAGLNAEAVLAEAADVLSMADSFDGIRQSVQQALRARAVQRSIDAGNSGYDYAYCWIADLFGDTVVYSEGDRFYRADYTIAADDTVTLGTPVEVERAWVTVTVSTTESGRAPEFGAIFQKALGRLRQGDAFDAVLADALATPRSHVESERELTSDLVPLVEKAISKSGTVPVKLIQPGQGSSGFYPEDVLKRDGPKVFTKGLHMYADHATAAEEAERPEGSIKNLMAVLETDAHWEDQGSAGPGLYADAKVMPHFAEHLEGIAPHIGISIRALGTFEEDGKTVKQLAAAKSVDFVTRAGAGGKVLELFEAARAAPPKAPASPSDPNPTPERRPTVMDPEEAKALREANTAYQSQLQESQNRIKQLEEAELMRKVADLVREELATIEMPEPTRKRLAEVLAQRPKLKEDGTIDVEGFRSHIRESVAAELRYLAESTGLGSGKIVGLGVSSLEEAEDQRAYESLEQSFVRMGHSTEAAKIMARGRN